MGFWEVYQIVEDFFGRMWDNYTLLAIAVFLGVITFVTFTIMMFISMAPDKEVVIDPVIQFIEQNAPSYCLERGYDSWEYRPNTTEPQFKCIKTQNKTQDIWRYVNMS